MGTFDGKVAFITGAARGQGRAHALKLASEGAAIVATDIAAEAEGLQYALGTQAELDETVAAVIGAGGKGIGVRADVRSQEQLDAAVAQGIEKFGHIDICLANAGVVSQGSFWEMTEETWQLINDIDLAGAWRTAKAVAPHMIEHRSGVIVMTASANALEPATGIAHYTAAKHGLLGLVKSIALEVAEYGIRCNAISPGAVDTPMNDNPATLDAMAGRQGGTREDLERAGRNYGVLAPYSMMRAEEVAEVVAWLCSDAAARLTGINVPIEYGHLLIPGYRNS